jgi:hypothetical protein
MTKTLLAFASALLLAACASTPGTQPEAPAAKEPYARIAPPVAIPPASARKVVLNMTGPKHVVESSDWGELKREWRETFADHAREAGIDYAFVEDAKPSGQDGTLLQVEVADYRIVGIGARIMFGIMTGDSFLDAKVRYLSLRDGAPFGEQQYNTRSSAWDGVFAKMTPQQVNSIAGNVFMDITGRK